MAAPGEPVLYSFYVYQPSKTAPIAFTVLYGLSALFHIYQCYRYKAFKLIGLQPMSAAIFTLGYALREFGACHYLYKPNNQTPLIVFVLSQVFIYICPPLLELANYHILGRIFYYVPHYAPIPANRVLATFGGLMAVVEVLNALGVALTANPTSPASTQTIGSSLSLAALSIQIAVIATFITLAGIFHYRLFRSPVRLPAVHTMLCVLYISMVLILARCIYRLVEHVGSTKVDLDNMEALEALTPLLRYEAFFLVFDSSLMLVNSLLWNVWHPGRFLPHDYHIYIAQDGSEVHGPRDKDARSPVQKTLHALSFGLLFRRKRRDYRTAEELNERLG